MEGGNRERVCVRGRDKKGEGREGEREGERREREGERREREREREREGDEVGGGVTGKIRE